MTDASQIAARLREIGPVMTPEVLSEVQQLLLPLHEAEPYAGVTLTRDAAYGPDPRHRLDIFLPDPAPHAAPVLVFVHGGGFTGGDKKRPGLPFQDNVALWAVRNGMIGVNITYRLAPDHPWPAAAEDVGAAFAWLRRNLPAQGADADRIFLFGTSAGAAHVAGWLATGPARPPAGAILLSGIYDPAEGKLSPNAAAYFGTDPGALKARSPLAALATTQVPLLVALAELDPPPFQRQALLLVSETMEKTGRWPRTLTLPGQNHFSGTASLNALPSALGDAIRDFIAED